MSMLRLYDLAKPLMLALLLLVSVDVAAACGGEPNVELRGVSRVTHLSSSGMNLWVDVVSERCSRVVVKYGEIDIELAGEPLASISLRDKVVVPRRHHGEVLLPLRFQSQRTFALISLLRRIAEGGVELTVSYRLRIGTPLFKRTLKGEDIPLKELLREMTAVEDMVLNLLDIVK